jgi:transposase
MSAQKLARLILLAELEIVDMKHSSSNVVFLTCKKSSTFEICPKCANIADKIYDHRTVKIKDEPFRGKTFYLVIQKRRFYCKSCKKPFMEPVSGISKGKRTTQRFQASVCRASELYSDLSSVQRTHKCSADTVYRATYAQLELNRRKMVYDLPTTIGIDEHSIRKPKYKGTIYATILVDHKNKRVYELMEGRSKTELDAALMKLKGRENVKQVTLDLSPTFKNIVRNYFPNAEIVADRFHVQRLFSKRLNKMRKSIKGDARKNPIRTLILRNNEELDWVERRAMWAWLNLYPQIKEVYEFKEALRRMYKINGYNRATKAFTKLTDRMGRSKVEGMKELRSVLMSWREEILNYHRYNGISNGRVEGFNRKAKLCQRKAYGFKKFGNYRLRLLNLCA